MWGTNYRIKYQSHTRLVIDTTGRTLLFFIGIIIICALLLIMVSFPQMGNRREIVIAIFGLISITSGFIISSLWIASLTKIGYLHKRTLIIGTPRKHYVSDTLINNREIGEYIGGMDIINGEWAFLDKKSKMHFRVKFDDFCFTHYIDEAIIFVESKMIREKIQEITQFFKKTNISYYLVPVDCPLFQNTNRARKSIPLYALPHYTYGRDSLFRVSLKRLFDIIFSSCILALLLPLIVLICLIIKIEDGGPILYVTDRVGIHKKIFKFYKFRTMFVNADEKKIDLLPWNIRKDKILFKMNNDPRITRIGKILRRFSFDEIPQFINVLKGDISIVGPRPHLPDEVMHYSGSDYLRLNCIPGIIGLPQLQGRNDLSFHEWVKLDLIYRNEWNLLLDFSIFVGAIKVVFYGFKKKVVS